MIIFKKAADLSKHLENQAKNDKKIGFVPTMGALHLGHISLISQSIKENNITVCSIFINPTQFNNKDDFNKYPVSIEDDIEMLENNGCHILFLPDISEIYPSNFIKSTYELGILENCLEGISRPGHYQGVCMVVDRLLSIIKCHHLYLGQKDYQQCKVICHLIELRNIDVNLHISTTVREKNGLALSSRNRRLSTAEQEKASLIFETLMFIKTHLKQGDLTSIHRNAYKMLSEAGFEIDYIAITELNLHPISNWDGKTSLIALIAVTLNEVRLIDNLIIA